MADLVYSGTLLKWDTIGTWKATSGLPGFQNSMHQFKMDKGPIPEGRYSVPLKIGGNASLVNPKRDRAGNITESQLDVRSEIESLQCITDPRDHVTVLLFQNWGSNRVRLTKQRVKYSKAAHRDGFYLHDSTKGFSHGCIEVETAFFASLRNFSKSNPKKHFLSLEVNYGPGSLTAPGVDTNGGTNTGVAVVASCPAP
ncbi:MAG: DUF2778 domain-containing protein [Planctomycetaceae bacterium]|nr:DUF2778 domain-containing protein [Planctomycetaceae bacterium]